MIEEWCSSSKPHEGHVWNRIINSEVRWTLEISMSEADVMEYETLRCPGIRYPEP